MKYISAFISNVILYYLFGGSNILPCRSEARMFDLYDDMEDYMLWAKKRLEMLFYECSAREFSYADKIRKIDTNLVIIFPFLGRLVDRSYIIEKFLTYLEIYPEEDSAVHLPAALPVASPPSVKSSVARPPSIKSSVARQPSIKSSTARPPPIAEPQLEKTDQPSEQLPAGEDDCAASITSTISSKSDHSPYVPKPELPIPLPQSIHKLRSAANSIGFPFPFTMTKKKLLEKLALYNEGLLLKKEVRNDISRGFNI